MNSKPVTTTTRGLLGAALCMLFAGGAAASDHNVTVSSRISSEGLDLSQPTDARTFYARLENAAWMLCTRGTRADLLPVDNLKGCSEDTRRRCPRHEEADGYARLPRQPHSAASCRACDRGPATGGSEVTQRFGTPLTASAHTPNVSGVPEWPACSAASPRIYARTAEVTSRSAARNAATSGSVPIVIRHQLSYGANSRPTSMACARMSASKRFSGMPVSKNTKLPCGFGVAQLEAPQLGRDARAAGEDPRRASREERPVVEAGARGAHREDVRRRHAGVRQRLGQSGRGDRVAAAQSGHAVDLGEGAQHDYRLRAVHQLGHRAHAARGGEVHVGLIDDGEHRAGQGADEGADARRR